MRTGDKSRELNVEFESNRSLTRTQAKFRELNVYLKV